CDAIDAILIALHKESKCLVVTLLHMGKKRLVAALHNDSPALRVERRRWSKGSSCYTIQGEKRVEARQGSLRNGHRVWLRSTLSRSSPTTEAASRVGGQCASPPGKRIALRPAKPLKLRCSSTLAISVRVSRCVCTAWTQTRRSALCRWYRGIPHPVARQRPSIDPQIRTRDHGSIVRAEKYPGFSVVRWAGTFAERHRWRGSAEKAAPARAGVRRSPKRDAPLGGTCHALGSVGGGRRQRVDADAVLCQFHSD